MNITPQQETKMPYFLISYNMMDTWTAKQQKH